MCVTDGSVNRVADIIAATPDKAVEVAGVGIAAHRAGEATEQRILFTHALIDFNVVLIVVVWI